MVRSGTSGPTMGGGFCGAGPLRGGGLEGEFYLPREAAAGCGRCRMLMQAACEGDDRRCGSARRLVHRVDGAEDRRRAPGFGQRRSLPTDPQPDHPEDAAHREDPPRPRPPRRAEDARTPTPRRPSAEDAEVRRRRGRPGQRERRGRAGCRGCGGGCRTLGRWGETGHGRTPRTPRLRTVPRTPRTGALRAADQCRGWLGQRGHGRLRDPEAFVGPALWKKTTSKPRPQRRRPRQPRRRQPRATPATWA